MTHDDSYTSTLIDLSGFHQGRHAVYRLSGVVYSELHASIDGVHWSVVSRVTVADQTIESHIPDVPPTPTPE